MELRNRVQDAICPLGEIREFEDPSRAVPYDGLRLLDLLFKQLDALRTAIHPFPSFWDTLLFRDGLELLVVLELLSADPVTREDNVDSLFFRLIQDALHNIGTLLVKETLANLHPVAYFQERVRHATADDDGISLLDQVLDELDLVADLCTTDDGCQRPLRALQHLRECLQLLLDQQTTHLVRRVHTDQRRV